MKSLDIYEFKLNIKAYMERQESIVPKEAQRLVLNEIMSELSSEVQRELYEQVKEREENKGNERDKN